MADAYWRYGDGRPQQAGVPAQVAKRPRAEFEMPSGAEMSNFYNIREESAAGHHVNRDIDTINASYDRYLRSAQQMPPMGGESGRSMAGGLLPLPHDDPRVIAIAASEAAKSRPMSVGGPREIQLPPDASSTLFVEGLPANCSRREVAHIFRPFVGYKEVRLVSKESRRPGGDPLLLCFVDFQSPAHAATAMDALQGYEFDEHERDSIHLRLQFARFPGARSGGGSRGKR